MADVEFFDCNCAVGRYAGPPVPDLPGTIAELLETFDYAGIQSAVVYHLTSKEYDAETGNEILMEELDGNPRLRPQWVLLPHHTGEFPPPDQLTETMLEHGILTGRIFPSQKTDPPEAGHNFPLADWSAGPLLTALQERRMPLFVDQAQITWNEVHDVCERYPDLPLILNQSARISWRTNRPIWPLWEIHENLYLDTAENHESGYIERIVERFGPERLLFGTGLPRWAPGPAIVSISRAQISADAKRQIASGNLNRLLEAVRR